MENLTIYQIVVALGLSGTLIMIIKFIPVKILTALYVKCTTRIYVTDSTRSEFNGILNWLNNHNIKKHIKSYYFSGKRNNIDISPGEYWFMLNWNTLCAINRKSNMRDNYEAPLETISIVIIGFHQAHYYNELQNDIKEECGNNKLTVMKPNSVYNSSLQPKRSFESIFLDNNITNDIKNKLDIWLNNKEVSLNKGLNHKIGFLFYGPPGTGKTTLAKAIASYVNLPLVPIQCGQNIEYTFNYINKDHIILFDDIDVLVSATKKEMPPITYDRLLSFIDGIDSPINSVFIYTTNNIELLPDALIRSGRIDYKYYLGPINNDTAYNMCKYFGLNKEETDNIVNDNTTEKSPADLQVKIFEIINNKNTNKM